MTIHLHMGWPQIITAGLIAFNLVLSAHFHGQAKTGKHNFFSDLISVSITLALLWAGGFWS